MSTVTTIVPLGFSDAILVWLCPVCTVGVWWIQPWCFGWALRRSLPEIAAAPSLAPWGGEAMLFGGLGWLVVVGTGVLARAWHASVLRHVDALASSPEDIPSLFVALVWYPLGMQVLRYLHCASVGSRKFVRRFGLTVRDGDKADSPTKSLPISSECISAERLKIFMRSTPTVIFSIENSSSNKNNIVSDEGDGDDKHAKHRRGHKKIANESWKQVFSTALLELMGMVVICVAVLLMDRFWEPIETWSVVVSKLLQVWVLGLSTGLFRILLEVPVRWWLTRMHPDAAVLSVYDSPHLATSPRDFWRRWSVSAGFHLREAFYHPKRNSGTNHRWLGMLHRWAAAVVPFAVNALLHATWWSVGIVGDFDLSSYGILLLAWPLGSLALQDVLEALFGKEVVPKTTERNKVSAMLIFHRALVWIGFCLVIDVMQVSQGAPPSLRGLCRGNLLLPINS